MLDIEDILATERMFDQNKLDVRTVTMGISLLSCVSDDEKILATRSTIPSAGRQSISPRSPMTFPENTVCRSSTAASR